MKILLKIICASIVTYSVLVVMLFASDRSEIAECLKWREQSKQHFDAPYFFTSWQVAQCDFHGVNLNN